MAVAYLKTRKGTWQKVPEYDDFVYDNQEINLGTYRDSTWVPNQLPDTDVITVGATETLLVSPLTPATGTTAVPDEMAHEAPRIIAYNETILRFKSGGRIVAEYFWKDIVSFSNSPPLTAA